MQIVCTSFNAITKLSWHSLAQLLIHSFTHSVIRPLIRLPNSSGTSVQWWARPAFCTRLYTFVIFLFDTSTLHSWYTYTRARSVTHITVYCDIYSNLSIYLHFICLQSTAFMHTDTHTYHIICHQLIVYFCHCHTIQMSVLCIIVCVRSHTLLGGWMVVGASASAELLYCI